jgi:hypothetical protein
MDIFYLGIVTLAVVVLVFYLVLFSFVYYWHAKKTTYVVVPLLFAFEIFIRGVVVVALVALILNYLPGLIHSIS